MLGKNEKELQQSDSLTRVDQGSPLYELLLKENLINQGDRSGVYEDGVSYLDVATSTVLLATGIIKKISPTKGL